jgi:hypothetical protein
MQRMLSVSLLGVASVVVSACGGTAYDPLENTSADFTITEVSTENAPPMLPFDLPTTTTDSVCVVGDALDALRPLLDDNGAGVFNANGRTILLTVKPIPEDITELWDQGANVGWACGIE